MVYIPKHQIATATYHRPIFYANKAKTVDQKGQKDQKSYNAVDEFVYQFSQAAGNLGVHVSEPVWEWVHPKSFGKDIENKVSIMMKNNPDLEFIMFFIDDKCSKYYTDIKQNTLPDLGILNSVVKHNTVMVKDPNAGGRGRGN